MAGFRLRVTLPSDNWSHLPSSREYSITTTPPPHHRSRPLVSRRRHLVLLCISFTLTFLTLIYTLHNPQLNDSAGRLVQAGKARIGKQLYLLESASGGWDEDDGGEGMVPAGGKKAGWMHGMGLTGFFPTNKKGKDGWRCWGWDPDMPEEMDPRGCLRARQYRQVMRVLEREKKAEHPHWYFTKPYNIEVFQNVSRCFLPTAHENYTACPEKPLIISGWWYSAEVVVGGTSGEVIWQTSLFKQIRSFGMSIATVGPYVNWIEVAEMMPDVYRFIWNNDVDTVSCVTDPRCIAKEHYVPPVDGPDLSIGVPDEERGVIPIWQLQVADYWGSRPKEISNNDYYWGEHTGGEWSWQPLGQQWQATPWALPGHVHLPYSIEEYCLPLPITPHEERNDSVLIFAKRSAYFHWPHVSPITFWTDLSKEPDFELLSTATVEEGYSLPEGLETMGKKTREEYEELVGSVKVLLGMGTPMISPSVYSSLCSATPVVLPYFTETHRTDGWYLYSGWSQHGPAAMIGPPYVYSYYSKNYTSLVEAVRLALDTPIDRYIPPEMKLSYALTQMSSYLERDLEAMFDSVLSSNEGQIPRLIKGARERCYELERCRDMLPEGRKPSTPERWERARRLAAGTAGGNKGMNKGLELELEVMPELMPEDGEGGLGGGLNLDAE